MKKILLIIISSLIGFSILNTTNAGTVENKLYKGAILTKSQIENDYSKKYNQKIESIFNKFRYKKDKTTLSKLKTVLGDKIVILNKKPTLNQSDKKLLNLYKNLYYRTTLILEYNLK